MVDNPDFEQKAEVGAIVAWPQREVRATRRDAMVARKAF
jgi:hypothetical protein